MTTLAEVLRTAKHVLLDFDGPICSIFAGFPAREVAKELREKIIPEGTELSDADPLALLRLIGVERPDLTVEADALLAQLEGKAAQSAHPTRGAEPSIRALTASEKTVWVVSNNSGSAIQAYLDAHQLSDQVAGVFGRIAGDPESMKPNPRLLFDAMTAASAEPAECVFVGDAVRDVEAGNAAGVPTIGYANKPGKDIALMTAGAVVVVDSMTRIAETLS